MRVECLIKRDGPTPVLMGGTEYPFQPLRRPGVKEEREGNPVTSVCEINKTEHLDFLLRPKVKGDYSECQSTQFRPYREGQKVPELGEPPVNLSGYSIIKHQDGRTEGYRIENNKGKTKQYCGTDCTWKPNTQGLVPFNTEFEAYQWLKEEAASGALDADEEKYELEDLKKELTALGEKVNPRHGMETLREQLLKARDKK